MRPGRALVQEQSAFGRKALGTDRQMLLFLSRTFDVAMVALILSAFT